MNDNKEIKDKEDKKDKEEKEDKKEKKADKDVLKRQNLRGTIKTTKYMLGFVWKERSGKSYLLVKNLIALVNALFPLVYTVLPGLIINELTDGRRIDTLALYVGVLTVTPVISQFISVLANKYLNKTSMELTLKYQAEFYGHVASMDYETLEKPDIQIMKDRAEQTLNSVLNVVNQLSMLVSSVYGLVAITSIIITLSPFVIIIISGIIYVGSLVTKWLNYKQFSIGIEVSRTDRLSWVLMYTLKNIYNAKEIRLFDLKSFLINIFTENRTKVNALNIKMQDAQNIASLYNSASNFVQQLILYIYMIFMVIKKGLPIGSMTIYMTAARQFSSSLGAVLNSYLMLTQNSLSVQEMMDFMNLPQKQCKTGDKTPEYDGRSIIEFRNVSFKYPGSEIYALKNINIAIRADEKLCIVGANGSGKSTFIKLLTRLYFPTEGEILLDGVNINEFDYKKYQRLFSPVFQEFAEYPMSLCKNIVLADELDRERLDTVCLESGLSSLVAKLPKGYETQTAKWIDEEGFNPSGGERQRIAIARAVYHGGQIFLLDEPTASLDPVAEYEIYTQFNKMVADKTAVLITHRLSAVQLADKVAVFDSGSLIEYGTHKQLYNSGGVYTEMFDKQAKFYRDGIQSNENISKKMPDVF